MSENDAGQPDGRRRQQALAMLKLVAMAHEDIRHGRVHSHDVVFAAARKRLAARRKAST